MARFTFCLVTIGVLLCASCAVVPSRQPLPLQTSGLVGRWSGADTTGKMGEMQFFPDGRIKFAVDGKRFGGKGNGSRFDVTYSVDATTTPWHLDVIAKRDGVEVGVLRGLLEVIDDSTIRVGFDTTSKQGFAARPAGFSSLKPESIILLKKEPDPSSGPNPASQGRLP